MRAREFISSCSDDSLASLIEAARDAEPVSGFTHNFYRYPARFSPKFVRAAITALSEPGDLILDPFMGGGTTLVEALALGRHAIGTDISSLAAFVAQAKTTLYSNDDLDALERWAVRAPSQIHMHRKGAVEEEYEKDGYYRHMDSRSTWRLRKAIEQSLKSAKRLKSPKLELFARCAILRTGQWALDGRKRFPSISDFRETLAENALDMIEGARSLRNAATAEHNGQRPLIYCLNRSTAGLEHDPLLTKAQKPRLVVTSPPYPGIHVLYHRWQVDGRKETPAPFWIANKLDGSGLSYYTMGDRNAHELKSYFDNLRKALYSVAALCAKETIIVQVMAFSQPSWQLPRYLSVAHDVGFQELFLPALKRIGDGRLWRFVPNRKWHANQKGKTNGSQEVVLFHRLRQ